MKYTLARYVARSCFLSIAIVLVVLVMMVVAAAMIDNAGDFVENNANFSVVFQLATYTAIEMAFQILPIACFLGAIVAGTVLARRGELIAAQGAGIRQRSLWLSFLWVVVIFAASGASCAEYLVPTAIARGEKLMRNELSYRSALTRFFERRTKWFQEGEWVLYLPEVDTETQIFFEPSVYRFEKGHVVESISADTLEHPGKSWELKNARVTRVGAADIERFDSLQISLKVRPRDLTDVTGDPRVLSRQQINGLIARRERSGLDTIAHHMELQQRLSIPALTVAMFMVISAWSVHPDRKRSIAVTLGAGLGLIVFFVTTLHIFRLLALSRGLPTALGTWGPLAFLVVVCWPLSQRAYGRFAAHGSVFRR